MDPTERLTESLIDSTWVGQATELFADELRDLELLEEEEDKSCHQELQRVSEVSLEGQLPESTSFDVSVSINERKDAKKPRKRAGVLAVAAGTRRGNADKLVDSTTPSGETITFNSSLRLKKDGDAKLVLEREQESWYRVVQELKQQLHQAREEAYTHWANAFRQRRFFSARGIDDYTMAEILVGSEDKESERRVATEDASSEPGRSVDAQVHDRVLQVLAPLDTPTFGTGTTFPTDSNRTEGVEKKCEFIIDSIAFANNLNALLEKRYGFCFLSSSFQERRDSSDKTTNVNHLKDELLTHAPGDLMVIKKRWHSTLPHVQPIVDRAVVPQHIGFIDSVAGDKVIAGSLPPVFPLEDKKVAESLHSAGAVSAMTARVSGGGEAVKKMAKRKVVDVVKMTVAHRSGSSVDFLHRKPSKRVVHIECSAKDNSVTLQTIVGVKISRTIRFVNRSPNLLCVRILPSKHAWITYSIVKSSVVQLRQPQLLTSLSELASSSSLSLQTTLDKPLACGGFVDVQITFCSQSLTELLINETLHLLHTRDLNSRGGEGSHWHVFDVSVQCETILPRFHLIPILEKEGEEIVLLASASCNDKKGSCSFQASEGAVTSFEFPYTYIMDRCIRWFYLENIGSDAIIVLSSTSLCFKVDPAPESLIFLSNGERANISVCFAPVEERRYDGEELVVTVLDSEERRCVVAEHRFALSGEGLLPHVELMRIGELELSAPQQEAGVPQYIIPSITPGVETKVFVTVHNSTPVAVPYFWRVDTLCGGRESIVSDSQFAESVTLCVTPDTGVFCPLKNEVFCVSVQAAVAQSFVSVLNLFLRELPTPQSDGIRGSSVALYSHSRAIPALPAHCDLQNMLDPYSVFQQHLLPQQEESCDGVFATGFYLFGDPVVPSFMIIPDHIEEVLECLVHSRNVRRIMLRNLSPRPLNFCFNPRLDDCLPGVMISSPSGSEDVEVEFEPRKGCVPPHSSVSVTFCFIVRVVGFHSLSIDCYIPELMEPLTPFSSEAETGMRCSHQLHLSVTGIGPSVRTSTECLDFGFIELGGKAGVSFTVTNDNPIPVIAEFRDSVMQEQQRFVFLPHSFRLGVGGSVEVTVYRHAVDVGDSQTFFELVVQGGSTLAIETRATIQAPLLLVENAVVNFGVVPENVWVEGGFVLFNTSVFDIPYTLEHPRLPPCMKLSVPSSGVVQAGKQGVHVPIRCAFGVDSVYGVNSGGRETVLLIRNTRVPQEILVEVCCERIQTLAVTVDLIPVPKTTDGICAMAYAPPHIPGLLPPPPLMEMSFFVEAFLWNLVELQVLSGVARAHLASNPKNGGGNADSCSVESADVKEEESQIVLRPYCPAVTLKSFLPDREPVWSELFGLRIINQTGCESTYTVDALRYPLNAVESILSGTELETSSTVLLETQAENTKTQSNFSGSKPKKIKKSKQVQKTLSQMQMQNGETCSFFSVPSHTPGTSKNVFGAVQRAFWCKGQDGTEMKERERRATLVGAQKALLDGRGCATVFGDFNAGSLCQFSEKVVAVSMLANLPGRYDEKLRVACCGLPPTDISLTWELSGKPVILDSNMAGLLVLGGRELMLMPSVIAGVGRSRRSMFLINRVPRDLNVSVNIFLTASTFSVVAVDENVDAAEVTLQLMHVSEEEQQRESEGKGKVFAAPETFLLPAMASREVTVEYAPDPFFVSEDGFSEQEWRGGVIITAEVANTSFNDGFIIDEFYRIHAAQYPAQHVIKSKLIGEPEPAWVKSIVRPVAMLRVKQTLVSRPGVVKNNVILQPSPEELGVLTGLVDTRKSVARSCNETLNREGLKSDCDNGHGCCQIDGGGMSECSGDDDKSEDDVVVALGAGGSTQTFVHGNHVLRNKPKAAFLARHEERKALLAFIEKRRMEMLEQSRRYFVPIELELRARCGIARLSVEPPGDVVYFPPYVNGESCKRVLQLTNQGCAAMEFMLDLPSSAFHIVSTRLVLMESEVEPLEVEDEETSLLRSVMNDLKWTSCAERRRAQKLMTASKKQQANSAAGMEVKMATLGGANEGRGVLYTDAEFVTITKYRLCPQDVLEVLLEYCSSSSAESDAVMGSEYNGRVEAALRIMYLPTGDSILKGEHQHHEGGLVNIFSPLPILELTQSVPLVVTFASVSVTCRPSRLWFRPGQLLHDGRPQPSYAQRLQLVSSYPSPVTFRIVPSTRTLGGTGLTGISWHAGSDADSVGNRPAGVTRQSPRMLTREHQIWAMTTYWRNTTPGSEELRAAGDAAGSNVRGENTETGEENGEVRQGQRGQKGKEEEQPSLLVEDPNRFTITPTEGVIQGATRGGQPAVFDIFVTFREHANVRFEASFDVLINGQVCETSGFTLCGDSRETEI